MLRIDCPPKLNLYLRIAGRRDDGYHELETVFQSVSGGDILFAEPAEALTLTCDDPSLPTDERNLVIRAGKLLQGRFPGAGGARLRLIKGTPTGAGMGGGSVDAAAALVLLAALWQVEPAGDELADMAAKLGSDVPFFLMGGTALARGRGERLEPLPTGRLWLVLLRPPVSVSTPWAYSQWRPEESSGPPLDALLPALTSGDPARVAEALRNDLEPGVSRGVPEIAEAREWLLRQGALGAQMTGSGSVVFGIARDEAHARALAARGGAPGRAWAARCLTASEAELVARPCER